MSDATIWARLPFHFWTVVYLIFGSVVGSFLNVCIHRMPRGESIVHPRSHCPHCSYSIPWHLNIPVLTWLWLGGRCANCKAVISPRYLAVELLTGILFAACWIVFGHSYPLLAPVYCLMIGGLIAATFIDFEHFIIPDELTIGGMVAGFLCSFLVPALHFRFPEFTRLSSSPGASMVHSVLGMVAGMGILYIILRLGKLFLGRQRVDMPPGSTVFFTETAVHLPEVEIPYEELFYRASDVIELQGRTVEMLDRCYRDVAVQIRPNHLQIGPDSFKPEEVPYLEAQTERIILPREAMGLGDVKFMGAIGSFLGWPGVVFSLVVSSLLGALIGILLVVCRKREWSSRLQYGPYIAVGAVVWIFGGYHWWFWR